MNPAEEDRSVGSSGSIEAERSPTVSDAIRGRVVVLRAYRNGELEREVGRVPREVGFGHVSLSSEVADEIGLLGRGETTIVDAY